MVASHGLNVVGKGKQPVNVSLKGFLAVVGKNGLPTEAIEGCGRHVHVMNVGLILLPLCACVIIQPSLIEGNLFGIRKEWSESGDGSLEGRK